MLGSYYIDVTPDVTDVPAETWSCVSADKVVDSLMARAGIEPNSEEARTIGLLELVGRIKLQPLSEETKEDLRRLSPAALKILEEQEQYRTFELEY